MTSRVTVGRPLGRTSASRRYGLRLKPQVRETIILRKGQPVKFNRVFGGAPGVGELTSTKQVSPLAIRKVIRLGK